MAAATVGAVVLSLGAWASAVSAEGDEPAEPAPTTTVPAEPAPTTTTTVVVAVGQPPVPPGPGTTVVAVAQPPVPPGPSTTVVAVGRPPVPAATPAAVPVPLARRPVVEITSTRVVDDAVRNLAEQLDELADLL